MSKKEDHTILIKKDGRFYIGHCLEIPQTRGRGDTKQEAIEDTKKINQIMQILSGR